MNKEEIDKWLDEEYGCSYTRLEELHDFYFEKYCDLKQENQQLNQLLKDKSFIIDKLMEENRQLKESRYKAIGHINACGCVLTTDESRYLLEILKGENK